MLHRITSRAKAPDSLRDRITRNQTDNESFHYDANGNRLTQVVNGVTTTHAIDANSNRLASVGNHTLVYDANGNTLSVDGVPQYHYDKFNRLDSAGGMTYYVNPEGQRLRKAGGSGTYYFAPDRSGAMLAEFAGGEWIDYVWLDGRLVGRIGSGQIYAVHTDQVGRPEAVTNVAGATVWMAQNFAFTRNVVMSDVTLNLGFPGQYYDDETGLWNNGFRDYDGGNGRYIESDPLGLVAGANTYDYVHGDSIQRIDPLGLDDTQCMYDPLSCGMATGNSVKNFSLGLGAWGNLLGGFGSGEIGGDVDTTGTMCVHHQVCGGLIAGLPVQGEVGVTGGTGTGSLCSGVQRTKGAFVIGGAGVAGGGQVTGNSSGVSMSKGIIGFGGSPEGGAAGVGGLQCRTEYWCTK